MMPCQRDGPMQTGDFCSVSAYCVEKKTGLFVPASSGSICLCQLTLFIKQDYVKYVSSVHTLLTVVIDLWLFCNTYIILPLDTHKKVEYFEYKTLCGNQHSNKL